MKRAGALEHKAVLRWHLGCGALALLATLAFASPRAALSLLVGAALGLANFHALFRFAARALLGGGGGPVHAFALRFVLLALALWTALALGAAPVALVLGLSLIMPAVLLAAWQTHRHHHALTPNRKPRAKVDDDAFKNWNPWLARENAGDENESCEISLRARENVRDESGARAHASASRDALPRAHKNAGDENESRAASPHARTHKGVGA